MFFTLTLGDSYFPFLAYSCFPITAELFKQRLDDLRAAETLEDVRHLPGHYHEMRENRKGQWACELDQPYRLIFEPHENPIPTNEHAQYIWLEIKGVEIVEIVNYHKEG